MVIGAVFVFAIALEGGLEKAALIVLSICGISFKASSASCSVSIQ